MDTRPIKRRASGRSRVGEGNYAALFERSHDCIYIHDLKGHILDANPAALDLLGYEPGEVRGLTLRDLVSPDHFPMMAQTLRELSDTGTQRTSTEFKVRRKDGQYALLETKSSVIYRGGRPWAIQGIARDVTERRRSENIMAVQRDLGVALTEVFALQDALRLCLGAAIKVSGLDSGGIYIIDPATGNLKLSHIQGTSDEFVHAVGNISGRSDRARLIRNGHPVYLTRTDPFLLRHKDQMREGIRSLAVIPISSKGRIIGCMNAASHTLAEIPAYSRSTLEVIAAQVGMAIEKAQIEETLRQSEAKYRGLFENAVMGIYRSTPEGRIVDANIAFARILGYDSPEDVMNSLTDMARQLYVQPEQRNDFLQLVNERGNVEGREIEFFRKDGHKVWVVLSARVVRDGDGTVRAYEGALRDVTERKWLESQLREAQKMEAVGTLARGIAHDFNNILSSVIGYADLARHESQGNDVLQSYLERIYRAGKQAGDLVKQLLTFSRQTSEKRYPLTVGPVIKEVLKLLRSSLPSTVEIQQELRAEPDTIMGNPVHIHQVLINLCNNAVQFMPDGRGILKVGLSSVEVAPDGLLARHGLLPCPHLRLSVSDTGRGIDPAIREQIFNPFFTTKKPGEGSGMGLSVVHGIVKSYGGGITVQSEVGKGADFHVYFPLLQKEGRESEAALLPIPGGSERVLFVDDDEVIVNLVKQMLIRMGYRVVGRTGSLEALNLFRTQADLFDLLITDMTMPDMTGLELAREIMLIRPDVPILLCTGFTDAITPKQVKALGLKGLVTKPILPREIAAAMRRALDRKDSRRGQPWRRS